MKWYLAVYKPYHKRSRSKLFDLYLDACTWLSARPAGQKFIVTIWKGAN